MKATTVLLAPLTMAMFVFVLLLAVVAEVLRRLGVKS
jgi:hypothetical protein